VTLAGGPVAAGSLVYMLLGAANRDPARFSEPDRLDIGRTDNSHLTFGGGIHYCVGAALARLEAQIAVAALVERFPGLCLATDQLAWRPNATLRGLAALPVVV
jgi:cytochrome P450